MTTNLYLPFFEATKNVFQLMLDLSQISECSSSALVCDDATSIAIGIIGDLKGEVTYHFPCSTALSMVNIMSGMEMDRVDEFVTSAISEITNIISGNALTLLTARGLTCDILPPQLRQPDQSHEYTLCEQHCITTSIGDVCLDIRLNPNK